MTKFLQEIIDASRPKPHVDGITMVLDRISIFPREEVEAVAQYIDVAKIGWGIPFIMESGNVKNWVDQWRRMGVSVSNGGTLLEYCITKGKQETCIRKLAALGFGTLEISEGVIEISRAEKKSMVGVAKSLGMRVHIEVGKKDSRNQLTLNATLERIRAALDMDIDIVIVEGRESGKGVAIYDESGNIKWDWVDAIVSEFGLKKIMFEAPQEFQQTSLIIRLGKEVNLGNIALSSVAALETQRQSLRGDTFGIHPIQPDISGGPSPRFVYFIISSHGTIDQDRIMKLTGLNRRTTQNSLSSLIRQWLIRETRDMTDLRRKLYSISS